MCRWLVAQRDKLRRVPPATRLRTSGRTRLAAFTGIEVSDLLIDTDVLHPGDGTELDKAGSITVTVPGKTVTVPGKTTTTPGYWVHTPASDKVKVKSKRTVRVR